MMRDAALAGLGIALLPLLIARAGCSSRLGIVNIGVQPDPECIYLAHPQGRRPSAKLRAFADCLRQALANLSIGSLSKLMDALMSGNILPRAAPLPDIG